MIQDPEAARAVPLKRLGKRTLGSGKEGGMTALEEGGERVWRGLTAM